MIITNVPLMANILSENIDELIEIVRAKTQDRLHANMKFRNISLIHKEITEWVSVSPKTNQFIN